MAVEGEGEGEGRHEGVRAAQELGRDELDEGPTDAMPGGVSRRFPELNSLAVSLRTLATDAERVRPGVELLSLLLTRTRLREPSAHAFSSFGGGTFSLPLPQRRLGPPIPMSSDPPLTGGTPPPPAPTASFSPDALGTALMLAARVNTALPPR